MLTKNCWRWLRADAGRLPNERTKLRANENVGGQTKEAKRIASRLLDATRRVVELGGVDEILASATRASLVTGRPVAEILLEVEEEMNGHLRAMRESRARKVRV
jgi:hypothetical protein